MEQETAGTPRRRLGAALAVSLLVHVLVGVLLGVSWNFPGKTQTPRRGEPLMVELQNGDDAAPRGNPSARAPSPPPGADRASPPRSSAAETPRRPQLVPSAPVKSPSPRIASKAPTEKPVTESKKVTSATTPPAPPAKAAPAPSREERADGVLPRPSDAATKPPPQPTETARPSPPVKETPPPSQPAQESRVASLGKPGEDAKGGAGGRLAPDIRSALRGGGGQGTPGGLIGGRGGIDGEPVPLDSKDPNFSDYLNRIRRAIQEKWGYPCVKNFATGECKYESAELVIEFGILKNGKLQFIELRTASGLPIYDEYALNAIKFASPFPEIPQAIMATRKQGSSGIPIVAHFHYVYEVSVRTLLQ